MSRHNQVLGSVSVLSIFHAADSWCRLAGVGKCTYTRIGMLRLGLMIPVWAYGLDVVPCWRKLRDQSAKPVGWAQIIFWGNRNAQD